jgi:hypothetical protein
VDIDPHRGLERQPHRLDYWDIPEVAALLRIMTHINNGGTLALCLWIAALALESGGKPDVTRDARLPVNGCQCEMMLVPIPWSPRQIANADEAPRS